MSKQNQKAWSGRFSKDSSRLLEKFNASIEFDKRLYAQDILGSIAHAEGLKKIGVLTDEELKQIKAGFSKIQKEIESGKFQWNIADEDIHMALEKKLGAIGKKLHTGRSRNDQVATDLRLYCKTKIQELIFSIKKLQKVFVDKAKKDGWIVMPGYTHLQRAQPIYLAHHLLAYFEMLERDKSRLKDTLKRTDISPLGSGALAGSPFKLDRKFVAQKLGFKDITHNSLDAVSDRDFAVELLFDISLLFAHLSRLAEELILWSSQEFGFVTMPEEYCTGSSMMPQKINPDPPELIRGKTGRVFGNLISLLTTLKSLPLAYNKDLQEDKEPIFDSLDTAFISLEILIGMIPKIKFNSDKMSKATKEGFLLATDIADYLVEKKIAFRNAHEISGKLVSYCLKNKKVLEELTLKEFQKFSKVFKEDIFTLLNIENSINRRAVIGGPSKNQINEEISRAHDLLRS